MPSFVDEALARAVAIPSSTIHAHVENVRRRNPEASPARLITAAREGVPAASSPGPAAPWVPQQQRPPSARASRSR